MTFKVSELLRAHLQITCSVSPQVTSEHPNSSLWQWILDNTECSRDLSFQEAATPHDALATWGDLPFRECEINTFGICSQLWKEAYSSRQPGKSSLPCFSSDRLNLGVQLLLKNIWRGNQWYQLVSCYHGRTWILSWVDELCSVPWQTVLYFKATGGRVPC